VYWEVRMTIIWAQNLNPRMTIKREWREYHLVQTNGAVLFYALSHNVIDKCQGSRV
jgi:hypothetical protein